MEPEPEPEMGEFQFKIARAKDLALSWFELVLCPEKFKGHLRTLDANPSVEPTALQLIVTFLEKASCIEGQPSVSENSAVLEERRKTLVDCALFMACFLHWDIATLEKSLPPAVQYSLLTQLVRTFPMKRNDPSTASLLTEKPEVICAHVLYSQWLVRFATQYDLPSNPPRGNTWEVTCATREQIYNVVEPKVSEAVVFLKEVCSSEALSLQLPRVVPAIIGDEEESILLSLPERSKAQFSCELWFNLGAWWFKQENFSEAHKALTNARDLLARLPHTPPLVDGSRLLGYLSACECVMGRRGREEEGERSLLNQVEDLRVSNMEEMVDVLAEDNVKQELPLAYRSAMEIEASDWSDKAVSMETEPAAKRPRRDHPDFSQLPVHERLCLSNAVRNVLEGKTVRPRVWQLLSTGNAHHFEFLFHLCSRLLHGDCQLKRQQLLHLRTFMRSVCSSVPERLEVWERLLNSEAKELALPQDLETYKQLLGAPTELKPRMVDRTDSAAVPARSQLERQILLSLSAQELTSAVEKYFKALPASEHKAVAIKWVGQGRGYIPADSIPDPLVVTKYNTLFHKANQLKQAKSYSLSLEFLRAALKLLSSRATSVSTRTRQQPFLQEQVLFVELLAACKGLRAEQVTEVPLQYAALGDKAMAYYRRSKSDPSLDPMTVQVAGAFLLNIHLYSFLAAQDQPSPGKISPRLANAVLSVNEGREMRKPVRGLFEAVLNVFSPPLNMESKSEQSEKQAKLRSYLDVFVENLVDPTSVSLLLAALARIWNILKKPEDEIRSEFSSHWPTAIGNPGSVDESHVFRSLSTALAHALSFQPRKTPWIRMQADMLNATGEYGPALSGYLEAGALESQHFEEEVPAKVWTQQVFRKIINCCSKLGYHTHAVVFCQFLEPVDYDLAFGILGSHSNATTELLFDYFWDMTIIEYLVYIHSKRGDTHKKNVAIQVAGQPELNFNNSPGVLSRTVQVRKRCFLRKFYDEIAAL